VKPRVPCGFRFLRILNQSFLSMSDETEFLRQSVENRRKDAPPRGVLPIARRFQGCYETHCLYESVERGLWKSSPGGATEISPAPRRWGKWTKSLKSRRDD
jgi:hypothetical protein